MLTCILHLNPYTKEQSAQTKGEWCEKLLDSIFSQVNDVHFSNIVQERHKYGLMADANLKCASPRRKNALEWRLV